MSPERSARRGGFALLDALIASVLLGLALVAILGLTSQAMTSQTRGERMQIASMLADELLSLVEAVGPDDFPRVFETRGQFATPFEDYAFEVDIQPQREGDPYYVAVDILWGPERRVRSERFETLIAPRLGDDPLPDRKPQETLGRQQ